MILIVFVILVSIPSLVWGESVWGKEQVTKVIASSEKPSISISTDRASIVPGNFFTISGEVIDGDGNPVNAKVLVEFVHLVSDEEEEIAYRTSTFSQNGIFYDNSVILKHIGNYKIHVTTTINEQTETAFVLVEVVDLFKTQAAYISYVGIGAFAGLMVIILKRMTSNPTRREILRFICITAIAITPTGVFLLTDVEIGQNGPFGLVLVERTIKIGDPRDAPFEYEWMINLGGFYPDYATGIQIPIFVLIFGVAGGYIRYLHTTYKLLHVESVLVTIPVEAPGKGEKSVHEVRIAILHQSMKDLALLFLAPLLAIASYFLLLQSGIASDDFVIIAAVSIGVGLVTDSVIERLGKVAGGQISPDEESQVSSKSPLG